MFSTCLFVRPSVRHANVNTIFENEQTDFDANRHKWSTGQGRDMINVGARRSICKVTRGRRYIWRPGGGTLLDSIGSSIGF